MFFRSWPFLSVAHLSVKELHALYARCSYGLQVARDALTSDIGIYEVEPRLGVVDVVGM